MKKAVLLLLYLLTGLAAGAQHLLLQERSYQANSFAKYLVSSAPDGQGNILFSGATLVSNAKFNASFLLVKPNADTLWTRKGPDDLPIEVLGIRNTPGGFLFYATKKNPVVNSGGALLQKLNRNGMPVWTKVYYPNPGFRNGASSALNMPDKGFILGGVFDVNGQTKGFALARTDSSGNILWTKHYSRFAQDVLMDIQFTANGNIIAVGTADDPVPPRHLKLMLLNQNGDSLLGKQLIVNCFNCSESMTYGVGDVLPLSDGGALINASVDTLVGINYGFRGFLVKVDASLNIVWKYVHRVPGQPLEGHTFTEMKELTDGSVLALGFKDYPTSTNSFQLYRFSPFGQLLNTYSFQSTMCTRLWGITLDALTDSTFMIGGRCENSTYAMYVATVKIPGLAPVVKSTQPELALQPTALGQSYPNPAQDQAIIPYTLPNSTKSAKVLLTDITGRQVGSYNLKTQQKQGSLPVNLSSFRNGLYLYSLVIDGKPVAIKKLAVAR